MSGIRDGRLDALVYRLREALGPHASKYIETRRGRGFCLNPVLVTCIPRSG
jgi:DNA-binding winged helix-turn-helix (wHTH) protein